MGFLGPFGDVLSHHELVHYCQIFCAKKLQSFNYSLVPEEYRKDSPVREYLVNSSLFFSLAYDNFLASK